MQPQPKPPTVKGPRTGSPGTCGSTRSFSPKGDSQLSVSAVHFTPGARTAWHSHDGGQTLYVTEGRGRAQARGEDVVELRSGDVHFTADGHEHWHGATHDHFMTHISITQGPATWGHHVTDTEYDDPTD